MECSARVAAGVLAGRFTLHANRVPVNMLARQVHATQPGLFVGDDASASPAVMVAAEGYANVVR